MVRSRDRARTAALQAEVVALRSTVAELREELGRVRAEAAASAAAALAAAARLAAELAEVGWVTLQMPLVQLALGDPADVTKGPRWRPRWRHPDRGEDTAETEIVLDPAPALEPRGWSRPQPRCWPRRPTGWPGPCSRTCPSARCWTRAPTATPSPATRRRPRRPPSTAVPPDPPTARRARPPASPDHVRQACGYSRRRLATTSIAAPAHTRATLSTRARGASADVLYVVDSGRAAVTCRCRRRRRTSSRGWRPCRATRVPGSSSLSTWTLLNEAERSFSRHGVFSPRETR